MKKYSTNYPLIFGIIFLILGIAGGSLPVALLFGVVPIGLSIWMKWSDHKDKKQGKETSTEKANRVYESMHPKKFCCPRCGINFSLVPVSAVKKVNGKKIL